VLELGKAEEAGVRKGWPVAVDVVGDVSSITLLLLGAKDDAGGKTADNKRRKRSSMQS
jgi:hypothetical protein